MKEKLPFEILILAGRLSLDGVVTVCVNSARMLRVEDKNFARLSKLSARATVHKLRLAAAKHATRSQTAIPANDFISSFLGMRSNGIELLTVLHLFLAGRYQYFTLTVAAHGADHAGFFHVFHQAGSAVVANFQMPLHQ